MANRFPVFSNNFNVKTDFYRFLYR